MEGYDSDVIPQRRKMMHYHGDEARALFVAAALVLVVAQSTGAALPLSTTGAIFSAVLLVVAAGITNPDQSWIHWFNALLAASGTVLFGTSAVEHYRAGVGLLNLSFTYTETLALLSLIALYYTTRTIRGYIQRPNLS
ncbi:MAG: hypothetical protein WCT45_02220 [Candidatus Paceibacterota bacterium]|jgi:hypothetical protein